jgi:hypothetical protein
MSLKWLWNSRVNSAINYSTEIWHRIPLSLFRTEKELHAIKLLRSVNKSPKNAEQEPEMPRLFSLFPVALQQ